MVRLLARTQVLDTLNEINERHQAVKELEKQLLSLHQIFLDMAVLVEAQGEMLDNIETQARMRVPAGVAMCHMPLTERLLLFAPQVAKANDFVNQGNKALTSAKELQKNTRKWMCCAMMLLLSICLIVVLAVVKPWQARGRHGRCFMPFARVACLTPLAVRPRRTASPDPWPAVPPPQNARNNNRLMQFNNTYARRMDTAPHAGRVPAAFLAWICTTKKVRARSHVTALSLRRPPDALREELLRRRTAGRTMSASQMRLSPAACSPRCGFSPLPEHARRRTARRTPPAQRLVPVLRPGAAGSPRRTAAASGDTANGCVLRRARTAPRPLLQPCLKPRHRCGSVPCR